MDIGSAEVSKVPVAAHGSEMQLVEDVPRPVQYDRVSQLHVAPIAVVESQVQMRALHSQEATMAERL